MFVLNEAKNEQKSSKNSKRHLEDESEDEETDQKNLGLKSIKFYFYRKKSFFNFYPGGSLESTKIVPWY